MPQSKKIKFQINHLNDLAEKQKLKNESEGDLSPIVHVCPPPSASLEPDPLEVPSNFCENSVLSFQSTVVFRAASCEEIYVEYLGFIQELPELIPSVRKNVLDNVRKHLNISNIEHSFSNLNFDNLKTGVIQNVVIDELSLHLGYSLRSIGPPVSCCKLCKKSLSFHHSPTQIALHKLTGPYIYSKYVFRCRACLYGSNHTGAFYTNLQDIYYHPDRFGNDKMGWKYYEDEKFVSVRASNEVFLDKSLVEYYLALLHHGWVSSEGKCEAYNELHRNTVNVQKMQKFLNKNDKIGRHFNQKINHSDDDNLNFVTESEGNSTFNGMHELHQKSLSSAVYNHEVFEELRERDKLAKITFGPKVNHEKVRISNKESMETILQKVDNWRTDEIYEHSVCTGRGSPSPTYLVKLLLFILSRSLP